MESVTHCLVLFFRQADIEFPILGARNHYEEIHMYLKNQVITFMGPKRCFLLLSLCETHQGCSEVYQLPFLGTFRIDVLSCPLLG